MKMQNFENNKLAVFAQLTWWGTLSGKCGAQTTNDFIVTDLHMGIYPLNAFLSVSYTLCILIYIFKNKSNVHIFCIYSAIKCNIAEIYICYKLYYVYFSFEYDLAKLPDHISCSFQSVSWIIYLCIIHTWDVDASLVTVCI